MNNAESAGDWRLRRVVPADFDGIYELTCLPLVYRYLFDGEPPPRDLVDQWLTEAAAASGGEAYGVWILTAPAMPIGGCVGLARTETDSEAELRYLLHPSIWGGGLATRAAASLIQATFTRTSLHAVVAGADAPNVASIATLERLGMVFDQAVEYPLGPGVTYRLDRARALESMPIDNAQLLPVEA